jgi:hypothetical protein
MQSFSLILKWLSAISADLSLLVGIVSDVKEDSRILEILKDKEKKDSVNSSLEKPVSEEPVSLEKADTNSKNDVDK